MPVCVVLSAYPSCKLRFCVRGQELLNIPLLYRAVRAWPRAAYLHLLQAQILRAWPRAAMYSYLAKSCLTYLAKICLTHLCNCNSCVAKSCLTHLAKSCHVVIPAQLMRGQELLNIPGQELPCTHTCATHAWPKAA